PLTQQTEAEDDLNVEVNKIKGRATVRDDPEEEQAGPERKGKGAPRESGTRGEPASPPPGQRSGRRESDSQEQVNVAFVPGSPKLTETAAKAATEPDMADLGL
ncbi:MAG TPA: hypothetical protein QGG32_07950, partial [Rhodospirillales bacterium]|nr:hypothetical protein [Rhodospirillales bacterium]